MSLDKRKSMKLTWIYFLTLDHALHMATKMETPIQLSKRGHKIHLITIGNTSTHQMKNSDIRVTLIPIRYIPMISPVIFGLILFFYLPIYIIKNRPDFIITDANIPFFSFVWKPILSKINNFKVIFDIRSTPVEISKIRNLSFKISVYWAKVMFEGITIITNEMKKEVCKYYKINPELVGVWSAAASTELFNYEKNVQSALELRTKFGLLDKYVIFYHGALSRERGIIECVKAMILVKKEQPDIVLFLLGSGPAVPDIENLIQKNELQNNVILHGKVDYKYVPKYIAMSDVGIVPLPNLPIWRYQCPLKLLEYLAMERPVIVTDIHANREIVQDSECAIYISSCNYILISKAMKYAYNNKEKIKICGKSGKKIINEKYNWGKQAEILEKYLLKSSNKTSTVQCYE